MDHENAFLEAIAAEPADLAHRLVFADWLEDHSDDLGRARAAFIRSQIECDSLPTYHPRARALRAEEAALLERHASHWMQPVAPLVQRMTFVRGFVEEVRLTPEQLLDNGPQLVRLAPIRAIQMRNIAALTPLLAGASGRLDALAPLLGQIERLDTSRDYLGDSAWAALVEQLRFPRLTSLHLTNHALTAVGIRALANSPVLRTLETLEITISNNAADALRDLLHSPHLGKLTRLSLAGARLGDRVARILTRSPLAPRLRSLSLSHNDLSPNGLSILANSRALAGLESLDLSFNALGSEGVRLLEESATLIHLKSLNLSRTDIADTGMTLLAEGRLLSRLQAIDLSMNGIDDMAGWELAAYPHPSKLLCLDLIYNSDLSRPVRDDLAARFGEDVCLFGR